MGKGVAGGVSAFGSPCHPLDTWTGMKPDGLRIGSVARFLHVLRLTWHSSVGVNHGRGRDNGRVPSRFMGCPCNMGARVGQSTGQ